MQNTSGSRNLSVFIDRDVAGAYEFLSLPENFPKWASGLGVLRKTDGEWIAETQDGQMKVRFSERNEFGVLDHWIFSAPDSTIYIPMRVVQNGDGCELVFTLLYVPGMPRKKFDADAEWVLRDLQAVKQLLEGGDA